MIDSIFQGEGGCELIRNSDKELDYKLKYSFSKDDFLSSSRSIHTSMNESSVDIEQCLNRLKDKKSLSSDEVEDLVKVLSYAMEAMDTGALHLDFWDQMNSGTAIFTEDK